MLVNESAISILAGTTIIPPREQANDPILAKLSKLKRNPVPTFFTLSVYQDRPGTQPELDIATKSDFVDYRCSYEKARPRASIHRNLSYQTISPLYQSCSTTAAVKRAVSIYQEFCKLELRDQTTSR